MPAGLPGATLAQNQGNPTQGRFVVFDPLSGPKGSPFDAMRTPYDGSSPVKVNDPLNISTGGLSTGIGHSALAIIGPPTPLAADAIFKAGFNDNHVPGERITVYAAPPPNGVVVTDIANSTQLYIGGGRMIANVDPVDKFARPFVPSPYVAGVALVGAGNGGSRDGGAGPVFTGFPMKMVTAAGAVANGAAIEAGFINRTGVGMVTGQSAYGSDAAALAAPA